MSIISTQNNAGPTVVRQRTLWFPGGDLVILGRRIEARVHLIMFTRELGSPVASSTASAAASSGSPVVVDTPWWSPDCALIFVLSLLYPHVSGARMPSSRRDWTVTHLLAAYLNLNSVKVKAEEKLNSMLSKPVDRVVIGYITGVVTWMQPNFEKLVESSAKVGLEAADVEQMLMRRVENEADAIYRC